MARKKLELAMPKQSKHEKMLSDMHDALYTLGDKIRKPFKRPSNALVPKLLQKEDPERHAVEAKQHIAKMHKTMRGMK